MSGRTELAASGVDFTKPTPYNRSLMAMIHVSRSGATLGIYDEARVREGLRTGEFIGTDLGWTEGMAMWRALSELDTFGPEAPPIAAPPVAAAQLDVIAEPAPATAVAATGLPWENRDQLGFFNAWIQTIAMVLTRPAEAFAVMRREGGFLDPLLFAVIGGTIGAVVSFGFSMLLPMLGMSFGGDGGLSALLGAGVGSIALMICAPIFVILGTFIGAGIFHICLMLVGGANRSFETTFRVVAYGTGSANLLQIVPVCGGMIAFVWAVVLDVIGLARAHETDTGRALAAVLLPLLLCCGGGVLLAIAIPAMIAAGW